jgi:hypothetical protein
MAASGCTRIDSHAINARCAEAIEEARVKEGNLLRMPLARSMADDRAAYNAVDEEHRNVFDGLLKVCAAEQQLPGNDAPRSTPQLPVAASQGAKKKCNDQVDFAELQLRCGGDCFPNIRSARGDAVADTLNNGNVSAQLELVRLSCTGDFHKPRELP